MPNEVQDSQGNSRMGPAHSAILLANTEQESDIRGTQDTVGDAVVQRLSDPAAAETARRNISTIRQRFAELTSALADDANANPALSDGETPRPSSTVLFGPRSRDGTESRRALITSALLRNRHSNPSDGSTTLGRRVEARASGSRDALDTRVRDVLVDSSFAVTVLNRHREQLLDTSRTFNSSNAGGNGYPDTPSMSDTPSQHPSTTLAARPWASRDRTAQWRENLEERRPIAGTSSAPQLANDGPPPRGIRVPPMPPVSTLRVALNRIDSLSNDLRDPPGLETESEAERRDRLRRIRDISRNMGNPIIVSDSSDDDDIYSWRRNADTAFEQSMATATALQTERTRAYMTANPIRDSGDLLRTLVPSAWGGYDEGESERTAQPYDPVSMRRRRRRGWARLDQDGNEIPTDDEEEYERNRAQMRSRAQLLSSRFMNGDETVLGESRYSFADIPPPPPFVPRLSSVFMPTTRNDSPSLPEDDGYVRINLGSSSLRSTQSLPESSESARQRRGSGRARRSTVSPIREVGTNTPFLASPIPWTSVDLTPTPRPKARDRRLSARGRTSGRAPLAGR